MILYYNGPLSILLRIEENFCSRLYNKFEYDKIHIDDKIQGDLNGNIKTTQKIF